MMQILVTLEKDADTNLLRKMIENMRGVIKTNMLAFSSEKDNTNEWVEDLRSVKRAIDPSLIDMTDDRVKYMLSK